MRSLTFGADMGRVETGIEAMSVDGFAIERLKQVFAAQRAAFLGEAAPSAEVRIDRVGRVEVW